jgi:uncharacterized RDD family membrane protein YckC
LILGHPGVDIHVQVIVDARSALCPPGYGAGSMVQIASNARASREIVAVLDDEVRESIVDGIITPEAVVLELETAGVASRVLAGFMDTLIQLLILLVISIVIGLLSLFSGGENSWSNSTTLGAIFSAVVLMGYPVLSETWMRGRTIGKKMFGLRAVTIEGAPIRFRHALLRMFGGLVDRFLPPVGITGPLFVLGTARGQRVGDLIAGTIVVRDPDRTLLPPAIWFPVPPGFEVYAAGIDPSAMTDEQYTVIRSFLMRNRELSPDARFSIASDLAQRSAAALRFAYDSLAVHPEAFLLCVIARYQRRTFPEYQPTAWQGR